MTAPVLLITDPVMLEHDNGAGHPERLDRLAAILKVLSERPIKGATLASPRPVDRESLELVHAKAYIDHIESLRGRSARLDADTTVSPASVDAALRAAGAAIDAVDHVMSAEGSGSAFALVRPPGHHAERDRAMGFCLFNNIAIAAAHAIARRGCQRVLIVDWDVHHGNGTQHMFEDRRDVLVFNTHQQRLFPNTGDLQETGRGDGEGFTVNCPLPSGTNDATYQRIFEEVLEPIAEAYRPDLVLVSAGFDAHREDPLGGMMLTSGGFAQLCAITLRIARKHARGRIALMLEGGYHLAALAESVHGCIEVLAGLSPRAPIESSSPNQRLVNVLRDYHRRHWPI